MSAATVNGNDAAKANMAATVAGGSKQQLKSGKALDGARKQAASPGDSKERKQQPPQPKAWQGPNPITQRASSSIPNGTEKPLPKLPTPAQPNKSSADSNADRHAHDRLLYILANFTGQDATLTLKNGEQFTGVFSGASFDSSARDQYVLKMVKRTRLPNSQQINGVTELPNEYEGEGDDHVMAFDVQDTVDLSVTDVTTSSAQTMQNGSISSSFRTDTEISGREPSMPRERELQRWEPSGLDSNVDMSLESSGDSGWDQFAANERMYGVQSTYDENFYTTAIDRDDPQYEEREAKAARIAREIEGSTSANAHVSEERKRDADQDDGMDEEDKYSGVKRELPAALPKRGAGSYIPPSQRPITGTPTVPGAPYDPAIISSQLAKHTSPSVPAAASPEKDTELAQASEPISSSEKAKVASFEDIAADSNLPPAAAKKPAEQTTEDHVRGTADAFKQFANTEKLRLRAAQEAKRATMKNEKNVRLNDLKKFAATFKLKTRVPNDLVPILAKDPEKQLDIQKRAEEAVKEEEARAKEREKEKTTSTSPSATASQAIPSSASITSEQRMATFNQQHRSRGSQQLRSGAPLLPGQGVGQSPRGPRTQQGQHLPYRPGLPAIEPLPPNLRIPIGPAGPPSASSEKQAPLSPSSATRLNVNAFEFRPAASTFTPSGASPSPQRTSSSVEKALTKEESASFFGKEKPKEVRSREEFENSFNPIKRMKTSTEYTEDQKKAMAANGGIPRPYQTPPTWNFSPANANISYLNSFPKSQVSSQGPSPMHTPNPNAQMGHMPHAHQLPPQLQAPHMSTPSQRAPFYGPPQHGGHQPQFHPNMQHFGPNGSVQSSPRFPPAQMAGAFAPQMPQFAGQPMQGLGMPQFGMSPGMPYRQMQMPQGGPIMMMPNQQQPGHMPQMRPGYPQPQFGGAPQMPGAQMMMQQPSQGGYMNGPMSQQPYSPMPPHAQPHMPHMQMHQQGGPAGYSGSPRPPMMQHAGSHQGFQPQPPMHMPPFAPSPGQPHPYHMQQRQMSAGQIQPQGFPQMTPRQQSAVPHHQGQPSPGMGGGGQGDEGK